VTRSRNRPTSSKARREYLSRSSGIDENPPTRAREIRALLESHGFKVERTYNFNRAGTPPWFLYSRLFGSRKISKLVLKVFDKSVWIWRRIDWLMPWRGLSLILVARKSGSESGAAGN